MRCRLLEPRSGATEFGHVDNRFGESQNPLSRSDYSSVFCGVALKRALITAYRLMAFVAVLAIDFAVLVGLRGMPDAAVQIGILGAIPMADILAVCLAIVVSGLVRRGEVSLSRVMFLFVGGTAILLLVAIAQPGT